MALLKDASREPTIQKIGDADYDQERGSGKVEPVTMVDIDQNGRQFLKLRQEVGLKKMREKKRHYPQKNENDTQNCKKGVIRRHVIASADIVCYDPRD